MSDDGSGDAAGGAGQDGDAAGGAGQDGDAAGGAGQDGDAVDDEAGDQPTVSIGDEGFQPGDGQRTTAGAENAVPPPDDEFGAAGWLLVGVIAVCFLVLPVVVTLRPVRVIGFRTTYLLLPLVPAFLLGATAVWVAVRSRRG